MDDTWLILDTNYLCHRSFWTTGGLSYEGEPTGTLYGVFRDVLNLQRTHATKRVVFAFDMPPFLRRLHFPGYKANRRDKDMNRRERETYLRFKQQVNLLREVYLFDIGFRNVFAEPGYEADDIIARVVRDSAPEQDVKVVVTTDSDMLQLLDGDTVLWNPTKKRPITYESFTKEWGVRPDRWPGVKALAGCSTDGIPGVPGVGEKTAAKWQAGKVKPGTKAYDRLVTKDAAKLYRFNLPLVKLPWPGLCNFKLREDLVTRDKWIKVLRKMGMKTLEELV
jgi:DNA polymerase-1